MQSQQNGSTTVVASTATITTTAQPPLVRAEDQATNPNNNNTGEVAPSDTLPLFSSAVPPSPSSSLPAESSPTDTAHAVVNGSETSGNENLEMLGDVASLLQTPTKKSLPQRKNRGKRKRCGDEETTTTPTKKSRKLPATVRGEHHVVMESISSAEQGPEMSAFSDNREAEEEQNDEDDGTLYKLVDAYAIEASSPFAIPSAVPSVASHHSLIFATTASTPQPPLSVASTSMPGSVESSIGPASVESDATRYHLVSSVESNDSSLLYRLTEGGGISSVESGVAPDHDSITEEADDDDDFGDRPPSSVAEVNAGRNPGPRTFQQLQAAAILDNSPGFMSSPEETVLFR